MDIKDSVDRNSEEYRGDSEGIEKEKKRIFRENNVVDFNDVLCTVGREFHSL